MYAVSFYFYGGESSLKSPMKTGWMYSWIQLTIIKKIKILWMKKHNTATNNIQQNKIYHIVLCTSWQGTVCTTTQSFYVFLI